jgi:hypothetical protein
MMPVKMATTLKTDQHFSFALVTQDDFAPSLEMAQSVPLPI